MKQTLKKKQKRGSEGGGGGVRSTVKRQTQWVPFFLFSRDVEGGSKPMETSENGDARAPYFVPPPTQRINKE
jgi:hypothetical protein